MGPSRLSPDLPAGRRAGSRDVDARDARIRATDDPVTVAPGRLPEESHPDTTLRRVDWASELGVVRPLFEEYRRWLFEHRETEASAEARVRLGLELIDRLIAALPGAYHPPRGDVILAEANGTVVACGALRELAPTVGEIKRIYVRADHRGPGFGPRLTQAVLDRARELGFERVRVDTLPTMTAAIRFYQEMGFAPIASFWPHPVAGALFFEYKLPRSAPGDRRARVKGSHRGEA